MPIVQVDAFLNAQFDYLIVGGGNTGAALATRLSENPKLVVGLLEAGPCHPFVPEIDIPGHLARSLNNSKYDWCLPTAPQEHANGREIPQEQGIGLGGTSLLNFMCYTRPSKTEVDDLADAFGGENWNWTRVLECMKKSEDTRFPSSGDSSVAQPKPEFHGIGGPIKQCLPSPLTADKEKDVSYKLFKAAEQLGVTYK